MHRLAFILDGKTVTTTRKVETVTKVGGATGKPAGLSLYMNTILIVLTIVNLLKTFCFESKVTAVYKMNQTK